MLPTSSIKSLNKCNQVFILCGMLLLANCNAATSPEKPDDIDPKDLASIKTQLGGCNKPGSDAQNLGCKFLDAFTQANRPQKSFMEASTPIDGKRWLGTTININDVDNGRSEFKRKSPYINLVVFGIRYSENFHQKLSLANGASATYIWPQREQEVSFITKAGKALQKEKVDMENPAVKFAAQIELEFDEVKESDEASLLLGNPNRYLRQRGDELLLIEKEEFSKTEINYLVSRISLANTIK